MCNEINFVDNILKNEHLSFNERGLIKSEGRPIPDLIINSVPDDKYKLCASI